MTYVFHTDTDPQVLDAFVIGSDQVSLFQCSPWAQVKNTWESVFTSVTEDGQTVGTALVLIRSLALGKKLMYIPRGPVMDYHRTDLVRFYLDSLRKLAKQKRCAAIRFDPAVLSRRYSYRDRKEDHPRQNEETIACLVTMGAKHRGYTVRIEESTQPRFNAEMDVEPDYRTKLEHKTAKCIRAAEHKGIEVLEGIEYLDMFCEAMHYTEVRKGVALRNKEYFRNMLEAYGNKGICMVTVLNFPRQIKRLEDSLQESRAMLEGNLSKKKKAEVQRQIDQDTKELEKLKQDAEREGKDQVVTCGILACYNEGLMELFYMGNNPDYLRMYSSYLLYALCLDRCAELGIRRCSFGGIEGTLDDGLTLFKSNWLMNVEEYIGEFNIVLDPLIYNAFDKVYPALLKTAAKLRSRGK